ncbi:MAG: hypothetical protein KAG70_12760 [Alcanivorax sp.]|nr:hypothetical protein [Alcanivorax sp.]
MKKFLTRTGQIRGRLCGIFAVAIIVLRNEIPLWIRIFLFLALILGLALIFRDTIHIDNHGVLIDKTTKGKDD